MIREYLDDSLQEIELPKEFFPRIIVNIEGLKVHPADGINCIGFNGVFLSILQESIHVVVLILP